MNNICVLGSINVDLVINVDRIPKIGETVFGNSFQKFPGGKGANQAVAISRLGNQVSLIGCVGNDAFGKELLSIFAQEGMNTQGISISSNHPTGIAFIQVNKEGNNNIIVVSGSNQDTDISKVQQFKAMITNADFLISQFEIPLDAVIEAFKIAKKNKTLTLLNPSPVTSISDSLYSLTDFLILNEHEAFALNNIVISSTDDAISSAKEFLKKGVSHIVLTLGSKGVVYVSAFGELYCPAQKVVAIDTTAAGDAFLGTFCSLLNIDDLSLENIDQSIQVANKVAAIVVQREGAQSSLPYLHELDFL